MVFVFTTTAPSGCSTLWKLTNSWNRATWWSIVKRDSRQDSATFCRHPSPSRSTVSLLCVLPPCPFFKQEKYLFFSARFFSVSPDLREGFFFVFFFPVFDEKVFSLPFLMFPCHRRACGNIRMWKGFSPQTLSCRYVFVCSYFSVCQFVFILRYRKRPFYLLCFVNKRWEKLLFHAISFRIYSVLKKKIKKKITSSLLK